MTPVPSGCWAAMEERKTTWRRWLPEMAWAKAPAIRSARARIPVEVTGGGGDEEVGRIGSPQGPAQGVHVLETPHRHLGAALLPSLALGRLADEDPHLLLLVEQRLGEDGAGVTGDPGDEMGGHGETSRG